MKKKFFSLCAAGIIFVMGNTQAADINTWGENRPSDELYFQYQSVFDNPLYYNQATGEVNWSANDGFAETPYSQTLDVGTWLDRFGYDGGKYVCPAGISYTMRSCAPGTEDKPYSIFVTKGATTV